MPIPLPVHLEVFATDTPLLVGVSGGRDSVALLLLLQEWGYTDLTVCHINHHLRGAESDADEQFCQALAQQLELPYLCSHIDLSQIGDGTSIEQHARQARHEVFANWMMQLTAEKGEFHLVALAHHLDDQAETCLLHACRGSFGWRAMRYISHLEAKITTPCGNLPMAVGVLRPLLDFRRDELTDYLQARGQAWREDASNADPAYATRNALRHSIIPQLNEIFHKDVTPTLARTSSMGANTLKALNDASKALIQYYLSDPQNRLLTRKLNLLSTYLLRSIIYNYLKEHAVADISQQLIDSIIAIIPAEAPTAKVNLPGGRFAQRRGQRLFIS